MVFRCFGVSLFHGLVDDKTMHLALITKEATRNRDQ